jgi:hypothetical protein
MKVTHYPQCNDRCGNGQHWLVPGDVRQVGTPPLTPFEPKCYFCGGVTEYDGWCEMCSTEAVRASGDNS